jgi:acetylornithine/N-succinyldiaminopimelate aminotransferase
MKHVLRCHDFIKDDIVRGDNCYLYDKDNKRYVDFESGVWCAVVGHANPRVNRRMTEQISKLTHLGPGYTNYLAEEAAISLLETLPGKDGKCVFLSSGSEAVEFGITAAKLVTGRNLMLTLSESYLGAYGSAGRKAEDWTTIDFDDCFRCEETECQLGCENLRHLNFDKLAAFVLEPGSSFGKVKFPPEKLIRLLVRQIRNSGGLVVVDEVTTGLGRTGKWYGFNHYDLKPDITAFGKGLGNGYPVSAVAIKNEIAADLEKTDFRYVQSHQNDPLGCAVAGEVIRIIREDDLVNRSDRLGRKLIGSLEKLRDESVFVKDLRGRGLMAALEFVKSNQGLSVESIADEMLNKGIIIGFNPRANLIRFLPPLTIEESEIDNMIDNLSVVLTKYGT